MEVAFGEGKVMNEKDLNTWKRLYEVCEPAQGSETIGTSG